MAYLKWRAAAIDGNMKMIETKCHYMHEALVAEFCFLQIRYCCEILALGCVAMHAESLLVKRLEKEWDANAIMKAFDKINAGFFPQPVAVAHVEKNHTHNHDKVEGALTKKELLETYGRLGDVLHIGHLKKYKTIKLPTYDFKLVNDFTRRIAKLLDRHTYVFENGEHMILIIMNDPGDGKVWLHYLSRGLQPDPPLDRRPH
jgi:hypothetical protein